MKDGLWDHYCPVEKALMGVGKGEPCNWCGAVEARKQILRGIPQMADLSVAKTPKELTE